MATKQQLQQWAIAAGIDPTGMSNREIEKALDAAANPPQVFPTECQTPWQKFQWAARNNARAIGEVIRGE